jgi:hypothetical protein
VTNTEALRLIKTNDGWCLLVWSLKLNEIVGVHALGAGARPNVYEEAFPTDPVNAPYVGTHVIASTATLELLRARQKENDREAIESAERTRIFRAWHDGPIEDLFHLLETDSFPAVVSWHHGTRFILEDIYYARATSLSRQHLERLNAIAAVCSAAGSAQASTLECWLPVIEGDRRRLLRYWDRQRAKREAGGEDFVLAVGDLQVDRQDILDFLVSQVASPGMFFQRFNAMVALGKIGATAGETSAAAIEQHIYDSDAVVAAIRRLTIARIRTPPTDWKPCDACVKGKAVDQEDPFPWFRRCCECFGLGFVLIEAPPEDFDRAKRDRDLWC